MRGVRVLALSGDTEKGIQIVSVGQIPFMWLPKVRRLKLWRAFCDN